MRKVNLVASPASFGIYPVTESSGTLPPNAGKHHDFVTAISDRYRAPSLLALPNANDAGARFAGADRLRAPAVRMPQMRSRGDKRHCVGSLQVESGRLACRRTQDTELREAAHAGYTKPGSTMHGLRFTHEADRYRTGRYGQGPANVYLPALQKGPAAHHRKCGD